MSAGQYLSVPNLFDHWWSHSPATFTAVSCKMAHASIALLQQADVHGVVRNAKLSQCETVRKGLRDRHGL